MERPRHHSIIESLIETEQRPIPHSGVIQNEQQEEKGVILSEQQQEEKVSS